MKEINNDKNKLQNENLNLKIKNKNKVNMLKRKKYTTKNENEEKDSEIISIEENSYKRCILSKESKTKTNRNSQKKNNKFK